MVSQRWQLMEAVLKTARELSPAERQRFLNEACAGDGDLLAEVNRLLADEQSAESDPSLAPTVVHDQITSAGPSSEQTLDPTKEFSGTERFRVQRKLGAGSMGIVYQAYDRQRDRQVALKTLRHVDAAAIYRLKHEFRTLADLIHPNLVQLYEMVAKADHWFYVMEFIDGTNFLDYVRSHADGQPSLARLRTAMGQLARGVCVLHEAGKVHRDIKPSNVLVTRQGRVVLLDFGLATDLEKSKLEYSTELDIAGTLAYMSPEQGDGLPLSPASDWYSVGVMLYEALAGKLPFQGKHLDVLVQKQNREPASPDQLRPGIPQDLNDLCVALLRRRPEERPLGQDVLRRLGSEAAQTAALSLSRQLPAEGVHFVGRQQHVAALTEAFSVARQGRTITAFVHGRSGVGKTALVEHFLTELMETGQAVVLAGRCYERESVPFKALDSLIDALSRYLRGIKPLETAALLPRDVPTLARLFPVLQRVDEVAQAPRQWAETPSPQELRRRAFAALRELLARIGDRQPLVLYIDDLQWGDVDSAALLAELVRPPDPPAMLLLACYRSEDATTSACLRTLLESHEPPVQQAQRREILVEPLQPADARRLAAALLHPDHSAATADAIARESGGSPYFVYELARFAQAGPANAALPLGSGLALDEVLWQRITQFPEVARQLLEVIAVAGRALPQADAYQAAVLGDNKHEALDILRSGRLVRTTGFEGDDLEIYHDRIRETVVEHLTPERQQELHRSLARALEGSARADAESLAVHWERAGEPEEARRHAVVAAGQAADALAFDRAAKLYRLALELRPGSETDERELRTRLGDALGNAGRSPEAAAEYLAAASSAGNAERLELERRAADQLVRSGHIDEGLAVLGRVLSGMGFSSSSSPWRAVFSLLIRRLQLRLRGLSFRERNVRQIAPAELTRIDICWSVSTALGMIDNIRGADFSTRNLLLALRAGDPYRIARALTVEVAYSARNGGSGRRHAVKLLKIANTLAQRSGHPHALGMATMSTGVQAFMEGNWPRAQEFCDLAEATFRDYCTGVAWELDTTHSFALWSLFFMGEVAKLKRRLPALLQEAHERGNLYAATNFATLVGHLLWLAEDDPAGAQQDLHDVIGKWSQQGFHVQHATSLIAQTQIDLYFGDARANWERLKQRWPALVRSFFLSRVQVIRVYMVDLRARCALALAATTTPNEPLLRAAERDAQSLEGEQVPWSASLARLIQAGIAVQRRQMTEAQALLTAAATGFDAVSMKLFAAASRRRLGSLMGGQSGDSMVREADTWMREQGVHNPVRITAMLAPGFSD